MNRWVAFVLVVAVVNTLQAQTPADPYSVKSSASTAVTPPQPPPGSELFNLSRNLYMLHWAKDNLVLLKGGLTLHEWNEAIENSTYGKVMNAIDTHLQGLGGIVVGVATGRLADSPIADIHTEKEGRDIASGRKSLIEQKPIQDSPVEHVSDPFVETERLVKHVLEKQGIPTALQNAKGFTSEQQYDQWLTALNKKINDTEHQLEKAAKLHNVPGRFAGLSTDVDTLIRDDITS